MPPSDRCRSIPHHSRPPRRLPWAIPRHFRTSRLSSKRELALPLPLLLRRRRRDPRRIRWKAQGSPRRASITNRWPVGLGLNRHLRIPPSRRHHLLLLLLLLLLRHIHRSRQERIVYPRRIKIRVDRRPRSQREVFRCRLPQNIVRRFPKPRILHPFQPLRQPCTNQWKVRTVTMIFTRRRNAGRLRYRNRCRCHRSFWRQRRFRRPGSWERWRPVPMKICTRHRNNHRCGPKRRWRRSGS